MLLLLALLALTVPVVASGHPLDVTDIDHDLIKNDFDNCPGNNNPKQEDTDKDALKWAQENSKVPDTPEEQLPSNNGRIGGTYYGWVENQSLPNGDPDPRNRPLGIGGDACDEDDDNDGFPDKRSPKYRGKPKDNCRKIANPDQTDTDRDGAGDKCDLDDDNDGVYDVRDNCPLVSNADQRDSNGDKKGDACDPAFAPAPGSLAGRNPNDHTPPAIRLRVARTQYAGGLGQGIAVGVQASEGSQLEGTLLVRGRLVGRGAGQIADKGLTFVFVKLTRTALHRLARSARVHGVLHLVAKDSNGNVSKVSKRIAVVR